MTKTLNKLVFDVIKKEIEEVFPEEIKGMTNNNISDLVNYIAEGFPDFIKDEINYYFIDMNGKNNE